jgi:hypothetical protein
MKNYVINNGTFTSAGNFSGYTALGERVHIYGRQMASNNWEANEDVKFPFYCLAVEKEIEPFGADGKTPTGEKVKRLTATSVFITVEQLAEAKGATVLVEARVNNIIAKEAVAAGLSESTIADLLSVAI